MKLVLMSLFDRLVSRFGYVHGSHMVVHLRERDESRQDAATLARKLGVVELGLSVAIQERDEAVARYDRMMKRLDETQARARESLGDLADRMRGEASDRWASADGLRDGLREFASEIEDAVG